MYIGTDDLESVVACINARPTFSTARLVYGELRNGKYVLLSDSPLFNILHGDIQFADVNGNGIKEIVIASTNYGNWEYPMYVVFDKNGRELTRQKKCNTTIVADGTWNFSEETGTCAIFGTEISFRENEEGRRGLKRFTSRIGTIARTTSSN
jgi:hypothetical protein